MSDRETSGSPDGQADGSVSWPGRSLERRHIVTALHQVRAVQHAGMTDVESALLAINHTSALSVAGAQYAGITTIDARGQIESVAPTHDYPRRLDDVQRETHEGPCLSAAWTQHVIHVEDLADEMRWPRYRVAALQRTPIRSVLSFRLTGKGKRLAALNFYSNTAGAFDDDSIEQGWIFASHTAVAWTAIDRERQFDSALAGRDVIGQAKGMLMERFDLDAVTAFELLRSLAQRDGAEIAAIAEQLVAARQPETRSGHPTRH